MILPSIEDLKENLKELKAQSNPDQEEMKSLERLIRVRTGKGTPEEMKEHIESIRGLFDMVSEE